MAALVHRPTEDAAIGRLRRRPLPDFTTLCWLLATAVRVGDQAGATLFKCQIDRHLNPGAWA